MTRNADRFLVITESYPPDGSSLSEVQIVQNWFSDLRQKVPAGR